MLKRFSFWLWATAIFQLLSAAIHSLSFFIDNPPANDTEKQMTTLLTTYKLDMGAGFRPTMMDLMSSLSLGFLLLCAMGGILNLYLWKRKIPIRVMKGVMAINMIVFGVCFAFMIFNSFLLPVCSTGLIFIGSVAAFATARPS